MLGQRQNISFRLKNRRFLHLPVGILQHACAQLLENEEGKLCLVRVASKEGLRFLRAHARALGVDDENRRPVFLPSLEG